MADNLRAYLIYRSGLLLSLFAVFLQLLVFLQPLLPTQFQVSPVCEVIAQAVLTTAAQPSDVAQHAATTQQHQHAQSHPQHAALNHNQSLQHIDAYDPQQHLDVNATSSSHQHDLNHHCQYCTVYANVLMLVHFGVSPVLIRTQVRMLWFKRNLAYVYFYLQQLFVLPQGRAPPRLA